MYIQNLLLFPRLATEEKKTSVFKQNEFLPRNAYISRSQDGRVFVEIISPTGRTLF